MRLEVMEATQHAVNMMHGGSMTMISTFCSPSAVRALFGSRRPLLELVRTKRGSHRFQLRIFSTLEREHFHKFHQFLSPAAPLIRTIAKTTPQFGESFLPSPTRDRFRLIRRSPRAVESRQNMSDPHGESKSATFGLPTRELINLS